jgi:beta-N-acetylhexosaminidase
VIAQPSCVSRTFAALSREQRIGQLFVIGLIKNRLDDTERTAIEGLHFGSMTFTTQTSIGVDAIRRITDAVQSLATPANTGSVGFFIAANQEGGLIQGLSGAGFERIPSALDQGSLSIAELRARAARWGRQLAAAGVNFNFAPVADVVPPGTDASNAPIGQLAREFGHDPATVTAHVQAFIAGMRQAGIATSAKHFPGLGRVKGNTDFTSGVIDTVTTRADPFIEPFAAAIAARVPFVMVSLATYDRIDPDHLAAFSPTVVTDLLRGELGFRGVVISDAIGATAAVKAIPPARRAVDFIAAGGDMIISNQSEPASEMARAIAARSAADSSFRARVDDAVRRVLRAKDTAGLLPCSD